MSASSMFFLKKKWINFIGYIIISAILSCSPPICLARDNSNLIVHFETNGRDLNNSDKKHLEKIFKGLQLGPETKILVVGYTDSTGKSTANYALSRTRATAVKNFLIALLKVDAAKIIAVGRGPESPVAGNDNAENRALNRRAEIFTLGRPGSKLLILSSGSPPQPAPENYMDLLEKAKKLVKTGVWDEALILLNEARINGAEHHALWHLLNGIIAYHQGIPSDILVPYFERALQLDPHNLDAIDYWGRARARKHFESGLIGAEMGRSANSAIKVETLSQQYELMKLFNVEPLMHARLPTQAIDMWQCRTSGMATINYFFDVSSVYQWAYSSINQNPEKSQQ